MPFDPNSLESCQNEIVRLERENASLRASALGGNVLAEPPDADTASIIYTRLEECLALRLQNTDLIAEIGRYKRALAVEQVRGRLLAAESARQVSDRVFRQMVEQIEPAGTTTIPTSDLMVLITAVEPARDTDGG